jgi:hypothetical protein
MTSSEITWPTAYWSLPPLAINTMMQPSGRVCGFDPSLRTYLRSSPIVCIGDATCIIVRFTAYVRRGLSLATAAKRTKIDRERDNDVSSGEMQSLLEQAVWLRIMCFVFGALFQIIKLMACSGLPWTQAWGCFYLASFVVVEAMNALASFEELDSFDDPPIDYRLDLFEKTVGGIAVLLQLAVLAWVDLAVRPPDKVLIRRWAFRALRLGAHLVVIFIYFLGLSLQSDDFTSSIGLRRAGVVMSTLIILVLLAGLHEIDLRYTQMYFMWSIIISAFSWLLFFFPVTRKHVLLARSESGSYTNVLAFDFFCRIFCFSLFWYRWYYNPAGTSMPNWINVFGN